MATLGNTKGAFIAEEYAENSSPVIRAQAAHVFGRAGGLENWSRLERMLNDPEPVVQVSAAAAVLRSAT